jgi:UTP--glucose-1-phosphate uridylyltransferase
MIYNVIPILMKGNILKVTKAVVPAAGFGTRFLPQTKAMPKEMLPLVDKPIIQYVVENLVKAGIKDVIIITGYHKRSIEDHFDNPSKELVENLKNSHKEHLLKELEDISNLANFVYIRQKGPYGNGTPLLLVKNLIKNEPFIYTWSDDMILAEPNEFEQLISVYNEFGSSVLASVRAQDDDDYNRWGFAGGKEIRPGLIDIENIIEKPGKEAAPSSLGNVSSFLFTSEIFDYLDEATKNLKEGQEFYYNDPLKLMLKAGKKVLAAEITGGRFLDTGNKLEYLKAVTEFGLKHPQTKEKFKEYLKNLTKSL